MYYPFRQFHIFTILDAYDQQSLPLDLFLKDYFRLNKALGSKDRAYIAEVSYTMIRWKGLLDFLCDHQEPSWEKRLKIFLDPAFEQAKHCLSTPQHIRLSFPSHLFDHIVASHGLEKACEICSISNQSAPTTVRVNVIKTSRDDMFKRWAGVYKVIPCKVSPYGIIFHQRPNFSSMSEFQEGLFEVQDEGSQLLAGLVQAKPGDLVMDYCAGAGGKTLAFAPQMQNKGQIYLHDVRKHVLQESKKRLRRAGIQNAQVVLANDASLKKLKKSMDWVLVDAPCTGTGTLRRNPDMKWRFKDTLFKNILGQQRVIFEKALSFLRADGHIVYSTCSILKEENLDQIVHFMKTYDLTLAQDVFESLPIMNGMDGFYGAIFKRS